MRDSKNFAPVSVVGELCCAIPSSATPAYPRAAATPAPCAAADCRLSEPIAGTWCNGIGRIPVHQPDTFGCGMPSSSARRLPNIPGRAIRERISARVIATVSPVAGGASNSFTLSAIRVLLVRHAQPNVYTVVYESASRVTAAGWVQCQRTRKLCARIPFRNLVPYILISLSQQ